MHSTQICFQASIFQVPQVRFAMQLTFLGTVGVPAAGWFPPFPVPTEVKSLAFAKQFVPCQRKYFVKCTLLYLLTTLM